jgi:hypothetical protein
VVVLVLVVEMLAVVVTHALMVDVVVVVTENHTVEETSHLSFGVLFIFKMDKKYAPGFQVAMYHAG